MVQGFDIKRRMKMAEQKMVDTSLRLCGSCMHCWSKGYNAIICAYIIDTGERRGCPLGKCDKYEKITKARKKDLTIIRIRRNDLETAVNE